VERVNVEFKAYLETQVIQAHEVALGTQVTLVVRVTKAVQVLLVRLDNKDQKDCGVKADLLGKLVLPDLLDSLDSLVSLPSVISCVV